MSDKRKALFIKCLKAAPEQADELGKIFRVKKSSLAAFKAHMAMGHYENA